MDSRWIKVDKEKGILYCLGDWRVSTLEDNLETQLRQLKKMKFDALIIDGSELSYLDSAGAFLIFQTTQALNRARISTERVNFADQQEHLFSLLEEKMSQVKVPKKPKGISDPLTFIGKQTVKRIKGGFDFLAFVGEIGYIFRNIILRPKRFQFKALLRTVEDAGFHALPIIALLSCLVGIVLAYQLGRQLETYGANIFIVDLSGMAILREFGPLITAIIVAGRTGSSFTAQIGLMKVNEEIDALRTMGLTPYNRIVVPRVLGMMIVMPLLTIWANAFAVFGSMIMSRTMLGITSQDFLSRFADRIDASTLWTGMGKTPVFALAIALVGCFQGFRVEYTAESIGTHTTMSVVQAIFLIIVIDAIFSVLYSWAGL